MKDYKVFFTRNYEYLKTSIPKIKSLTKSLIQKSQYTLGELKFKQFDDNERYYKFNAQNDIKNQDILLIGGTAFDQDVLELFDMGTAFVQYGAKSLTILCPYFGYSTMERAVQHGEIVMAKNRALILSAIPKAPNGNSIFLYDLHSEGIPFYFEGNFMSHHLYGKDFIQKVLIDIGVNQENKEEYIIASTDAGRAKWIESLGKDFGLNTAFAYKQRIKDDVKLSGINANVQDKKVIIYDDMIRSGNSLLNAVNAYRIAGAKEIYVITTHGLFVGKTKEYESHPQANIKNVENYLLKSGAIKQMYCTNSHPHSQSLEKVKVIDVMVDLLNGIERK